MTLSVAVAMSALVLLGVGDMVSVFIRALLVQLQTPDEIRGRVSARSIAMARGATIDGDVIVTSGEPIVQFEEKRGGGKR